MASKSLGTLTLDLVAKVGGFEAGMDKAERKAKRSAKEMEDSAAKAAKAWKMLGGVLGTIGAGGALLKVVDNTKQLEQQQAQLAAVLRSTGEAAGYSRDQLNAMAGAMSGASMFSTGEFAEAQTTLLAFTGIVGDQFPVALQAAADMAARTGMTVKAAAETIGRALDVPSRGLGSLSDQGFRFTDEQKKLAKQLESTGRTAEAQAIILDALQESYAGAAQAARDTFTGALTALQNTLGDLASGGEGSLDSATAAINGLADALASPVAREAVELLTDAAMVLAAVIAGRLVGSAAASAVAFASAQIQAARYQAALAGMAGVSKTAAAGIGAVSVAARASSAAFALVGGPFGAAALAAIAIGSFALSGREAKQPTVELAKAVRELSSAQREVAAIEAAKKIEELSQAAATLASNLAYAEENSRGAGKRSQRFAEDAARIRLEVEKTGAELATYQKRLEDLQNFKPSAAPSGADDAPVYDYDAIQKQIAALELAAKTAGMGADSATLYKLSQEGATEADLMRAEAALKAVGALEAQTAANERQQQANAAAVGIIESLQTEEEAIKASYERRREQILASTIHTEEEKNEAIRRLQEENDEQMLEVNGGFWEKYVAAAEDGLFNIEELAGSMLENVSARFGDAFEDVITSASSVGEAFEGLGEAMVRSVINATGQMLAQWAAYELAKMLLAKPGQAGAVVAMTANAEAASIMSGLNAFSSTAAIPIVGPALAPGAAAAAVAATQPMVATVTAAASAGLAGMAHDGIDSVPQTGTWLLEKGERVTTAETSAKLDRTLSEIQRGGTNNPIQVINNGPPMNARQEMDGDQVKLILDLADQRAAESMARGKLGKAAQSAFGLKRASR